MGMRKRDGRDMPCRQGMDYCLFDEPMRAIEDAKPPERQSEMDPAGSDCVLAEVEGSIEILRRNLNRQRSFQMSSCLDKIAFVPMGFAAYPMSFAGFWRPWARALCGRPPVSTAN